MCFEKQVGRSSRHVETWAYGATTKRQWHMRVEGEGAFLFHRLCLSATGARKKHGGDGELQAGNSSVRGGALPLCCMHVYPTASGTGTNTATVMQMQTKIRGAERRTCT